MSSVNKRNKLGQIVDTIFDDVRNNAVGSAVISCVRLARLTSDYHSLAFFVFLQESTHEEAHRTIQNEIGHLAKDFIKYVTETAHDRSLSIFKILDSEADENFTRGNLLYVRANHIDNEIQSIDMTIDSLTVPNGIGEFDTAMFYKENAGPRFIFIRKRGILLRIRSNILTACHNYASQIERSLQADTTAIEMLGSTVQRVTTFLLEHAPTASPMYLAAFSYLEANTSEGNAASVLQIRRLLKETADAISPPNSMNGLSEDKYLNRLAYFVEKKLSGPVKTFSLEAKTIEELLRHTNSNASKGVHSNMSIAEAKRVLFLATFLLDFIVEVHETDCTTGRTFTNTS